jgi:3-methyladenine DNA glycosylase/8-oxoguanine DNA glycosylase
VTEEPESTEIPVPLGYDLYGSFVMQRFGRSDPTARKADGRFVKSAASPEGPVTVELSSRERGKVLARAWGPGAAYALARVPAWVGAEDRPEAFVHDSEVLRRLSKAKPGLRLGRSPFPYDLHAALVFQQRVTFAEAAESFRRIALKYGQRAPGPFETVIFPPHDVLRRIPSYEYRRLGVDSKRVTALLEATRLAPRVLKAAEGGLDAARKYLLLIPGTGPWTAELLLGLGFGDADALPLGDVHLPHDVSYALTGEPWGSDERMVELLEPFRPHRFRVLRLISLAGPRRPYLDRGPPR